MLKSSTIIRQLAAIDPIFKPTPSVMTLRNAVEFVESQLQEKNVPVSGTLATQIDAVKKITHGQVIERPTLTMESIRNTLVAIRTELPQTDDLRDVKIPETVDAMRYVTSVEELANSLLSIIRGLDLFAAVK